MLEIASRSKMSPKSSRTSQSCESDAEVDEDATDVFLHFFPNCPRRLLEGLVLGEINTRGPF